MGFRGIPFLREAYTTPHYEVQFVLEIKWRSANLERLPNTQLYFFIEVGVLLSPTYLLIAVNINTC